MTLTKHFLLLDDDKMMSRLTLLHQLWSQLTKYSGNKSHSETLSLTLRVNYEAWDETRESINYFQRVARCGVDIFLQTWVQVKS